MDFNTKKYVKELMPSEFLSYAKGIAKINDYNQRRRSEVVSNEVESLIKNLHNVYILHEPISNDFQLTVRIKVHISFFSFMPLKLINKYSDIVFELEFIGSGGIDGRRGYFFSPWILHIEDESDAYQLENFWMFIPEFMVCHWLSYGVFIRSFTWMDLNKVTKLNNVKFQYYKDFGLTRENNPIIIYGKTVSIKKYENVDPYKITSFYKKNNKQLSESSHVHYFEQINQYNFWFEVYNHYDKLIGYIRLYNTDIFFDGGIFIEYIIAVDERNKGFASEAVSLMIEYIKQYSFFTSVNADVLESNEPSLQIINKNGFIKNPFLFSSLSRTHSLDLVKHRIMKFMYEKNV